MLFSFHNVGSLKDGGGERKLTKKRSKALEVTDASSFIAYVSVKALLKVLWFTLY